MPENRLERTREAYPEDFGGEKASKLIIRDLEKEILIKNRIIGSLVRQLSAVGHQAVVTNEEMHSKPLAVVTSDANGRGMLLRLAPRN